VIVAASIKAVVGSLSRAVDVFFHEATAILIWTFQDGTS
jgi:hypothetical protein